MSLLIAAVEAAEPSSQDLDATPFALWQAKQGDTLLVDTEANIGYLLHEDGRFASFPVATGQKRVVRYIGRTYNAATPASDWQAMSQEIKGDRITFGKLGRFLRLYKNEGTESERTPYGIHSHASIEKMLASMDRYRSMGCILVSEDVLDVILETFTLNEENLSVRTIHGLGDETLTHDVLLQKMSAL